MPGEYFVKKLFTSIAKNPAAWAKTLFVITFDEHGGTYDHVPPPWSAAPPWAPGPATIPLDHGFEFDRFGVRIPTILISPLIEPGTVFRSPTEVPYDHTSVLATILDWLQVDKRTWNLGTRTASAPTFDNVVTRQTPRTDKPFAPALPPPVGTPIAFGQPFVLTHQASNQQVIAAYSGIHYWYPELGTGAAVPFTFHLGFGGVNGGSTVQLFTSQYLTNTYVASGAPSTALGAWRDDKSCYYYPTSDVNDYQQQSWQIVRVTGNPGDPIRYGDQVRFQNVFFAGQGLVANGQWLTTAAGAGDVWVITPA
jgi:phospholipase C